MPREMKRISWIVCCLVGVVFVAGSVWAQAKLPKAPVDLNAASLKELEALPGVGEATAKKIVAGRPYKSVDELAKAGVPPKTIDGLKPLVTVGASPAAPAVAATKAPAVLPAPPAAPSQAKAPKAPVDLNTASQKSSKRSRVSATPRLRRSLPADLINPWTNWRRRVSRRRR